MEKYYLKPVFLIFLNQILVYWGKLRLFNALYGHYESTWFEKKLIKLCCDNNFSQASAIDALKANFNFYFMDTELKLAIEYHEQHLETHHSEACGHLASTSTDYPQE
ncbi:hypothetical protein [Capybara microvirus Cap1_SP_145]|nr:hypothetical protein [Capybara microvirus Cap1_SP_145]